MVLCYPTTQSNLIKSVNQLPYKVCPGFRLMNRGDYICVNFDLFEIKPCF